MAELTKKDWRKISRRARGLLNKDSWIQGEYWRRSSRKDTGGFCAVGALTVAARNLGYARSPQSFNEWMWLTEYESIFFSLVDLNDAVGATVEDVKRELRRLETSVWAGK